MAAKEREQQRQKVEMAARQKEQKNQQQSKLENNKQKTAMDDTKSPRLDTYDEPNYEYSMTCLNTHSNNWIVVNKLNNNIIKFPKTSPRSKLPEPIVESDEKQRRFITDTKALFGSIREFNL